MKYTISILALSVGLFLTGCGSNDEGHSHGEDGDHTHEAPTQQSSGDDGEPVRIGSGEHSDEEESDDSHDEDSDHSHDDDSTHSHGDEEHSH